MSQPVTVSIIIPVYNREVYVAGAIRSLLAQTWQDFEIIVVDDGSTDCSAAVVEGFCDPRIRLIRHERNRGISAARNTGLDHVRGRYTAWLDSDDIALPNRLAEQLHCLETRPEVVMVGACAGMRGPADERLPGYRIPPFLYDDIRAWLMFRSPFQQSSIFGRTDVLARYRYREDKPVCEDFDMFARLARDHPICNMPRVLVERRIHPQQIIRLEKDTIKTENKALVADQLYRFGVDAGDDDLERHFLLANLKNRRIVPDADFLAWAGHWLARLKKVNAANGYCTRPSIDFASGSFWAKACHLAIPGMGTARALRTFLGTPLGLAALSGHGGAWLLAALPIWFGDRRRRHRDRP